MQGWISLPPGALMDAVTHAFFTAVLSLSEGGVSPPLSSATATTSFSCADKIEHKRKPWTRCVTSCAKMCARSSTKRHSSGSDSS